MARGWESKGVEAQIEEAETARPKALRNAPDPATADLLRRREGLLLSRTRVLRELETTRHQRYREMLRSALEQLEAELAALSSVADG